MRVMGLGSLVHWIAWFIDAATVMAVVVTLMTLLLKYGGIMSFMDPSTLLVVLYLYVIASTMQAFFLSTLFSRANLAAAVGGVFYYLSFVPMRALRPRNDLPFWARIITVRLFACP